MWLRQEEKIMASKLQVGRDKVAGWKGSSCRLEGIKLQVGRDKKTESLPRGPPCKHQPLPWIKSTRERLPGIETLGDSGFLQFFRGCFK